MAGQMAKEEDKDRRFLIDLHLAEYQTLADRATNYIVGGTIVWPLMVSFLGFLVTVWEHLTPDRSTEYGFFILVWCGALGIQLALILWTYLVCEQYKLVLYIEKELRPRICSLVQSDDFWLIERKLRKHTSVNKWFELMTEFWVFLGIVIIVLFRYSVLRGFTFLDWIGLSLNLIVFGTLLFWGATAAKTHQKWGS